MDLPTYIDGSKNIEKRISHKHISNASTSMHFDKFANNWFFLHCMFILTGQFLIAFDLFPDQLLCTIASFPTIIIGQMDFMICILSIT